MQRAFLVAAAGTAIVVTVLAGCSTDESSTSSSSDTSSAASSSAASSGAASSTAAPSGGSQTASADAGATITTITVDGQSKTIQDAVECTTTPTPPGVVIDTGTFSPGNDTSVHISMTDGDSPQVMGIVLGDAFNGGVTYRAETMNEHYLEVSKDGNTYKVSGTDVGQAHANVYVEVSCP